MLLAKCDWEVGDLWWPAAKLNWKPQFLLANRMAKELSSGIQRRAFTLHTPKGWVVCCLRGWNFFCSKVTSCFFLKTLTQISCFFLGVCREWRILACRSVLRIFVFLWIVLMYTAMWFVCDVCIMWTAIGTCGVTLLGGSFLSTTCWLGICATLLKGFRIGDTMAHVDVKWTV